MNRQPGATTGAGDRGAGRAARTDGCFRADDHGGPPGSRVGPAPTARTPAGAGTPGARPEGGGEVNPSDSLECDLAIDVSKLVKRKRINRMQIHDGGDDVCQIMVDGTTLQLADFSDGDEKVDIPKSGSGWFFTMGFDVQTNVEK